MTAASSSYRLRLLGAPRLADLSGQTPPSLGWGKPLALLSYLAVRGEVRRDEIVDLLWRDVEEARAGNAFRQALHRLRTALGDDLIPRDRDRLRLGKSDRLSVDIVEFEQHAQAGRLDAAIALYSGDFLEGAELDEAAFDQWAEQERTRLRARFRQVLQDSVGLATGTGRWAEAIAHAKRLQHLAPFDSDIAKLAATTLISAGRRVEALELLRAFTERTERELGVPVHAGVQLLMSTLSREVVTDLSSVHAATASTEVRSLSFVGRESELSQLLGLWHTVTEDAGAVALLEGEAGIGKTRLVTELTTNARALGPVLLLNGRERAAGAQLPYGIFGEALRPLVRAPGVAGASAHLLAEAARLLPEMRDTFDLPPVNAVEDEASRLRFFEGVAALIDAAAYEQRTLIVLEELQHIPPSSLDLLAYLVARLDGAPVMFVLTMRPSGSATVSARLRALAGATDADESHGRERALRLSLGTLTAEQTLDALRGTAASAGIPASTLERIARQSGGNPLRLLQALRSAAAGEELSSALVPLRDVLIARLTRLSSTQRRVFLVLALLGRPASSRLLASAAHVSEPACASAARVLEHHGLVEEVDGLLRITNDLAGDVALDVAGQAGRSFLCGWIAEALAQDASAQPAELARMYATAGNGPQAFQYARRAAYTFLVVGAQQEAVQMFALARTFASSPQELSEIEGALSALGSGRRRLPVGHEASPPAASEAAPAQSESATPSARVTAVPPTSVWERLFPNWRVLFGAALATLLISAVVLNQRSRELAGVATDSADTLLVAEGMGDASSSPRLAIGSLKTGFVLAAHVDRMASDPAWVDSLSREWSRALSSPRGLRVAASRVTPKGMDLIVISRDRRDSTTLLASQPQTAPLGWSPDGHWLLAVRSRAVAGGFDAGLFAFRVVGGSAVIPIDTLPRHAVAEALWSPDGLHIAWVARVGPQQQLEVFTSLADGSDVRNVSRDPAEDYDIAWSPDGSLLAFTSMRDGNAELYAADLLENRLWRLTHSAAHDDRAVFSPDGRSLAFESTRGGGLGVYVMAALGGQARPVGRGTPMEIVSWRAPRPRFVDRVRVEGADVGIGDTAVLRVRAFDDVGDSVGVQRAEWRVLDSTLARFASESDAVSATRVLRGRRAGLARVAVTIGRWRSDTAFVRVGSSPIRLLEEDFSSLARWRVLGEPAPVIVRDGVRRTVLLRAARDWHGGILSRGTLPIVPGLSLSTVVAAPWNAAPDVATEASVALVAPEDDSAIDSTAPQFMRLASVSWRADVGRLVYAVGRETFSEPVAASAARTKRFVLRVEDDSTVSFHVDDRPRWRSTARLSAPRSGTRARLWIGGRATQDQVDVTSVSITLLPSSPTRRSDE